MVSEFNVTSVPSAITHSFFVFIFSLYFCLFRINDSYFTYCKLKNDQGQIILYASIGGSLAPPLLEHAKRFSNINGNVAKVYQECQIFKTGAAKLKGGGHNFICLGAPKGHNLALRMT